MEDQDYSNLKIIEMTILVKSHRFLAYKIINLLKEI